VGTTLEFRQRDTYPPLTGMVGGGPFKLAPGQWTDDTSHEVARLPPGEPLELAKHASR